MENLTARAVRISLVLWNIILESKPQPQAAVRGRGCSHLRPAWPCSSSECLPAKWWWQPSIDFESSWLAQGRLKSPSTTPSFMSFTYLVPKSVPNPELPMATHIPVQCLRKAYEPEQSSKETCSKSHVCNKPLNLGSLGLVVPNISNSSSDI